MLISNGVITRNIEEKQLPEYLAKGYKKVEKTEEPKKPEAPKKGKK